MIINGDCLEEMRKMEGNSISAIVTDPPYGLGFMGNKWDAGLPHDEIWKEALRVCKPGSFMLAFGGTKTYHRLTCAIEDAGWEIRDCMMWIYGSGFPKSHNHFGVEGCGTALKPAFEPIVMAMKPCDGTFKQNAEKWGQAGINIDGCRIGNEERFNPLSKKTKTAALGSFENSAGKASLVIGRWPANVIFDEIAGEMLDEQTALNPSRFFYCAKSSSSERSEGLEGFSNRPDFDNESGAMGRGMGSLSKPRKNHHPTVKPLKLMQYIIKLVMPPKDGILLDPFAGSGSTIVAAKRLGFNAIGIEKCKEYCDIANARVVSVSEENKNVQLEMVI